MPIIVTVKLSLFFLTYLMSFGLVVTTCPTVCHCNKGLTTVNCNKKSLKTVPENLPMTTEYLSLEKNELTEITVNSFKNLIHLKTLVLSSNKISIIQKNSFIRLSKLSSLALINNDLSTIENDSFAGASSLTKIDFNSNRFEDIPSLFGLTSLKSLLLNTNKISKVFFPPQYRQLKNLSQINLSNNKITELTVHSLINLNESTIRKISFSRNQISSIEQDTFQVLRNINSISFAENPLTAKVLKKCLWPVRNYDLISLDLSSLGKINILTDNIFDIFQNTSLRTLILTHNNITHVNYDSFKALTSLEVLKLDFCSITNLHESAFTHLNRLTRLFLNGNYISKLTPVFPVKLLYLYLNDNTIQVVPNNIFGQLTHLRELHLQYNKIVQFKADAFVGLEKLHTLKLQHNIINVIPGRLFSTLVGLVHLELGSNSITNIPEEIFTKLKSLNSLDLSNNHISMMPQSFSKMIQLQQLYLENNKLGNGFLLSGLKNLIAIDLSNNEIEGHLSEKLFQNNGHLKYISLSGNRIRGWQNNTFKATNLTLKKLDVSKNYIITFDIDSLRYINNKKVFNITMNPFVCNCDLRWFRDWLNTTTVDVVGKSYLTCNSPEKWQGKKLLDFDRSKIDCTDYTPYYISGGVVCGFLITTIIISIAYNRRWYIRLKVYKAYKKINKVVRDNQYEEIPGEDQFSDAYVSYCENDREWVETYLMQRFDNGENAEGHNYNGKYKLCFRERDFEYGKYVAGMIDESLKTSKKMLVILTPNYIKNSQCKFELNIGISYCGINNIKVIVVGDIKCEQIPNILSSIIEERKDIKWDKDEHATTLLTKKLDEFLTDN